VTFLMAKHAFFKILTIAGSDSGGGAGIQADLKTFAALKCYGMSAVTALVAENTCEVAGIMPASGKFVRQQIETVLKDIDADAIKIGMLGTRSIVNAVVEGLKLVPKIPLVLDPILLSSTGHPLQHTNAASSLLKLFPMATVVTPNIPEASFFANIAIADKAAMVKAGKVLIAMGARAVVVKGGHLQESAGKGSDCLVEKTSRGIRVVWVESPCISTSNTHGSGCTFSAALAVFLAHSMSLEIAVKKAKHYVHQAIESAVHYPIGQGCGPLHHFHEWWGRIDEN
jgi:hydroxymethylpyrimidine/phosphomethylpyrimidine kinase